MKKTVVTVLSKEVRINDTVTAEFRLLTNGTDNLIWIYAGMVYFCISGGLFDGYFNLSLPEAKEKLRKLDHSTAKGFYFSALSIQENIRVKAKQQRGKKD